MDNNNFSTTDYNKLLDSIVAEISTERAMLPMKEKLVEWSKQLIEKQQYLSKRCESLELETLNLKTELVDRENYLKRVKEDQKEIRSRVELERKKIIELEERVAFISEQNKVMNDKCSEERMGRVSAEHKLAEARKMLAGMTQKASEESVIQALRNYVNSSKRKKHEKKAIAKSFVLEMILQNKLVLPDDLATEIDSLDDAQEVPTGNTYNIGGDLAINKHVEHEVNSVSSGGKGFEINNKK